MRVDRLDVGMKLMVPVEVLSTRDYGNVVLRLGGRTVSVNGPAVASVATLIEGPPAPPVDPVAELRARLDKLEAGQQGGLLTGPVDVPPSSPPPPRE